MPHIDYKGVLLALAVAGALLFFFRRGYSRSKLFWPDFENLKESAKSLRLKFFPIKSWLVALSLLLFTLALMNPYRLLPVSSQESPSSFSPKKGAAVYFVLDRSGSMKEPISILLRQNEDKDMTKLGLLKEVLREFIQGDPAKGLKGLSNDLVGLVAFARAPIVLSPLTLDHRLILEKLNRLETVKDKSQDGTAIGYAIYKTAHLIASSKEYFKEKGEDLNALMIVVTDGLQDPNPMDRGQGFRTIELEEAAEYAKTNGVKVYIINIEPKLKEEKFAPNLRQMKRVAEMTGGKFYLADGSKRVRELYDEIGKLEKSHLPIERMSDTYEKKEFYPYLIIIGLLFLAAFHVLDNTWLRENP